MSASVKIEVDERTARMLEIRAAELGMTVSELIAELATVESEPIAAEPVQIAELDRRWKKVDTSEHAVPQERVVHWLRTWGTRRFETWPRR